VRAYAPVLVIAFAFICSGRSFPQSVENEGKAILELGAAADRSLTEGQSAFGPTVAVEVTPIENWLELEAGVTPLFRLHSTEWSVDFLFKKPLDHFRQNGVHAGDWSGVDSFERIRRQDELSRR
jgi:hypothetical protein